MSKETLIIIGVITAAIVIAVLIIRYLIRSRQRENEEAKYRDAAARMIKENCLDEVIATKGARRTAAKKTMIYLRVHEQQTQGFVFDPVKGIRIGRDPVRNEICIRDAKVSAAHCCIYVNAGRPIVQDYRSSNGTWHKRGRFHRFRRIRDACPLKSGDCLRVGDTRIEVQFFNFDMMQL